MVDPARADSLLLCDCEGTMTLDGARLARALGRDTPLPVSHQLCGKERERLREAAATTGGRVCVACTQEAPSFAAAVDELEEALGVQGGGLRLANIREQAGWSREGDSRDAYAKMAALLEAALLPEDEVAELPLASQGVTLIYGRGAEALEAANLLKDRLDITVMLTGEEEVIPPAVNEVPICRGRIRSAKGHFGAFELVIDGFAPMRPSSRQTIGYETPRDGAISRCDLILDLSGGRPLFPASQLRDGYLRADPGDPAAVMRRVSEIAELEGDFDKPRYITFEAELCAHGRSGKTGCTRCLDLCPTGAISPDGDSVSIDPAICAGCGSCAAVCPTGAATYAPLTTQRFLERVRSLLATYRAAGGEKPVLLVHEEKHGRPLIDMLARFGEGLPGRVIPLGVPSIDELALEALLGALALGAADLRLLSSARRLEPAEALRGNLTYALAALDGLGIETDRIAAWEIDDPDMLSEALAATPVRVPAMERTFLPMGGKRGLLRSVLQELHAGAPKPVDLVPMPKGAPFGGLAIDTEGCTLCLACVSACPTGALSDNPDRPMLSFTEDACVQCGLCANTCPESVIALEPRLNFTDDRRRPILVKSEEPYHCVRCGTAFGTRSSVERVIEKMSGGNWMYENNEMLDRIRMCADCRVIVQSESRIDPYRGPARPATRTTEDYRRAAGGTAASNGDIKVTRLPGLPGKPSES